MRQNDNSFERPGTGSPGQRAGRGAYRRMQAARFLPMPLGLGAIGMICCELWAGTATTDRIRGWFLLFLGTVLALELLLRAWSLAAVGRVRRKGPQARYDYNRSLYLRLRGSRRQAAAALCNQSLLAMAKLDFTLNRPEQALLDLDGVKGERLTKEQLKTFYFYQAAAARLTGDEGLCAAALLRCKAIPVTGAGYLTEEELEGLFGGDTPASMQGAWLTSAVSGWGGQPRRQHPLNWACIGLLAGYTAWYYGVAALLPYRYEYRTGFTVLSLVLIFWGWAVVALVLLYKGVSWLWPRLQSGLQRIFVGLMTALAVLAVLVYLVGYGLLMAAVQDPEEEIGDGLLIVTDENYLRPEHNTYTYYQAHGPFLRSYYGPVEDEEDEDGETGEDGTSSAADSAAMPEASDSMTQPEAESAVDAEEPVSAETPEEEALLLIAQSLADSGALDSADLDALTLRYSAKGSLYAVLWSEPWEEDESVTTRGRLVYDRESANAKCYLFVYYQDYLAADGSEAKSTSILEFYAVNKVSGEVIPGDKHSWSDVASAEYREATGE